MASRLILLAVVTSLVTGDSGEVKDESYWPQPLCHKNCQCSPSYPASNLTIDCNGLESTDSEQLIEQLDSLLSSNLTYGRLTSLRIVNTPLTRVPRSICRLTTLTELHLDHNELTRLPDNCLTNLVALTSFTASYNNITQLQDGVLDGLQNLETLELSHNHISSIGLGVFTTSAGLTNLRGVRLKYNRLETVEPWAFFTRFNATPDARVFVDLARNRIKAFTNTIGWKANCDPDITSVDLDLSHNSIKRVSDLFFGWNISVAMWWCIHNYKTLRVEWRGNYIACDCVDFEFYGFISLYKHVRMLDDVYCGSPESLYRTRVTSVPLDEFVCEVTDRCPPGCRCVHRPANSTLHVDCSNTNLTVLPPELPQSPKSYTKYKLDFSSNRFLRRLGHRDYFVNASILDVSNCSMQNWTDVFRFKTIYLHGNRLTTLPQSVLTQGISSEHLSLYNNPWRCICGDKWMAKWLNSTSKQLINPSGISCGSPKRFGGKIILQTDGEEFCKDPVTRAVTISLTSFAGPVVVLLSVGICIHRLRVMLYTRWKFHPFDRDECLGEDMDYDVFLSCSSDDNLPHGNTIRKLLEQRGYRVCYPPRDFVAGETVYDNIYRAVIRSKRTVCFVSKRFLKSVYCMQEFDISLHHNVMVKRKKRLIVLMALDSPIDLYGNDASDTDSLRHYLSQYTYIDYTTDDWLDNLLYALPLHGLDQIGAEDQRSVNDRDVLLLQ